MSVVLFSLKDSVSRVRQLYLQCISVCTYQYMDKSVPVQYGFLAAVKVVKFLLGHRVIHVHGGNTQLAGLWQLVQPKTQTVTSWWRTSKDLCEYSCSFCVKLTERCLWRSPPRCPLASWTGSDTSCGSSGSGRRHHPKSDKNQCSVIYVVLEYNKGQVTAAIQGTGYVEHVCSVLSTLFKIRCPLDVYVLLSCIQNEPRSYKN